MNGFEKRRENKKNAILNAALELFKQFGYNKTSISEIAQKASVSQVSIYNFFGSKENLKRELLSKLLNDYSIETTNILNCPDSIKLKLEKLLASTTDFIKRFSIHFILESIENDAFINEHLLEERKKITEAVIALIEKGKSEGVLDNLVSTQSMIVFLEIFQYYFNSNPSALVKYDNDPELFKEVSSLFLKALLMK